MHESSPGTRKSGAREVPLRSLNQRSKAHSLLNDLNHFHVDVGATTNTSWIYILQGLMFLNLTTCPLLLAAGGRSNLKVHIRANS